MPKYAKFMKELPMKKHNFIEKDTIELEAECNVIIQKTLPAKHEDPRSFTIPINIGNSLLMEHCLIWGLTSI